MQLFYAPEITLPAYTLSEEESKHCIRVLRLEKGEELHLTDGRGNLYHATITDDHPKRCTVTIHHTESPFEPLPYHLTMAVAPTKNNDRYEWFLEKATEVGVDRFIPLESAHSERRTLKRERMEKVVVAAMKQSLKAFLPQVEELTPFAEVIAEPFEGRRFIAHCNPSQSEAGKQYLASVLHPGEAALILIGPEGDFSPEEVEAALAVGFEEISLGTQRLRTETAAVVASVMVSVVNNR
ncbi:MAG: 16S rRNA (uracil(1498)-N(3))-methyltransferase [Alistipes sp.]|nr:16S rRNA (uracil(1498)-N(3))-methyltransferase [Alistipes sp.]MBQ2392754.1 16S rRNA (uracil(1498)-N(3))-methyltransferase [Alistipes sp.]